ncbi:unnamed protein product [Dracunculus medinensis]|uniref:Beta-lactamase domain-containing protein n=1 Tax=Dracunculus medinensis TaxID=318479 RepID=A0A0N4USC7_DRAME|nr:unnamed protein product [Dracunculus medinensis]
MLWVTPVNGNAKVVVVSSVVDSVNSVDEKIVEVFGAIFDSR